MRQSNMIWMVVVLVGTVGTARGLTGSGTEQDPWLIQSLADFDEFASDPNYWDDYTRLETDVNLAGRVYERAVIAPDVNDSEAGFQGTAFTGVFDGNGHKIMNLTIDGHYYLGLFGYIEDGNVQDLGIEGGAVNGNNHVGGLVGANGRMNDWLERMGRPITDCYFVGYVSGEWCVGGLVGSAHDGSISNCHSTGQVDGWYAVGGLVGNSGFPPDEILGRYTKGAAIADCYSASEVSGFDFVGGLVGMAFLGSISNCFSTGDVNGQGLVGGLVGAYGSSADLSFPGDAVIAECYSTGCISGICSVGGLVGGNGAEGAGGFAGGTVTGCHSTGDVDGHCDVGGLVGINISGDVPNCWSMGSVSGGHAVGGLVGSTHYDSNIAKCYSIGDVNGVQDVGGLIGINQGIIDFCYSTGNVSGDSWVGGLAGLNNTSCSISNCYSTGNVSNGYMGAGGLVGDNEGLINNCYSTSNVSGYVGVGGLVGLNDGSISTCYSTGEVSGSEYVAGLVGRNEEGSIQNAFWDVEMSGEPNMCGSQEWPWASGCDPNYGKTTAEMHQQSTFTDWDFINVWNIGENQTYPYLRTVPAGDINKDRIVNLFDFAIIADQWMRIE